MKSWLKFFGLLNFALVLSVLAAASLIHAQSGVPYYSSGQTKIKRIQPIEPSETAKRIALQNAVRDVQKAANDYDLLLKIKYHMDLVCNTTECPRSTEGYFTEDGKYLILQ